MRVPERARGVATSLSLEKWEQLLLGYPDEGFKQFLLRGIRGGFRIGFQAGLSRLRSKGRNMSSAAEHPEVVSRYLQTEEALGRVCRVGTIEQAEQIGIHCSPFGIIPKRGREGKWRLILDLSSPEACSVNDGVPKELSSLSYITLDDVAAEVLRRGKGTLLAKMDVKQAYRQVAVDPRDRHLLGMAWQGQVYVDTRLPFGLRSAPLLFTAVADAAQWAMKRKGVTWAEHYIDDFVTMGQAGSVECGQNVALMRATLHEAGLNTEPEKDEGPATAIGLLGMEIDTVKLEISLPADKLARLISLLQEWQGKKACRKRELLSLIGLLSHASKAVRSGRTFLRRLIDLSMTVKRPDRMVRLNQAARSDLEWWRRHCESWNGRALMLPKKERGQEWQVSLESDASGSWGCGAIWGAKWLQVQWQGLEGVAELNITIKELLPIILAAAIWGRGWAGKLVRARCDNMAVVAVLETRTSKERDVMHLLRCLAFLEAGGSFQLVASHIRGEHNSRADAVSRGRLREFFTLHPQAEGQQTAVPAELVDLLLGSKPDWSSVNWTRQWCSCVPRDWQIPLDDLTSRLPRDTCSSVLKPVSPPSQ